MSGIQYRKSYGDSWPYFTRAAWLKPGEKPWHAPAVETAWPKRPERYSSRPNHISE